MPVIGQPAHTHFTPVISPIVLTRVSLSIIYLYDVSAPSYRVSLVSTYLYDLYVKISLFSVYLYNLNPVAPVGPTRLYFHAVLNTIPNLPTTERSVLTPNKVVDAENISRTMSTIIGTVQTSLVLTSNATTTLQRYYFARFVSDTLQNVTSITAQTWTYNFSTSSNSAASRYPANGTNQPVRAVAYVWRPSTGGGSKVGDIIDGNTASTVDSSTAQRAHITTFAGNQVLGVNDGDVLCFEVWFEISQGVASALTDSYFYDGPTVTTVKNTLVSNHASFIQTPQGLAFGAALVRVSKPLILKYDMIAKVLGSSGIYRYNIAALVSFSPILRYNITSLVSVPSIYLYNATGRISFPSITKYNILVTKSAPKIFRYALQSTTLTSRTYKYNLLIALPAPNTTTYRYNIANYIQLPQIYKYNITLRATLSRIYRYSTTGRAALARIYKYNIAIAISLSQIYKYALFSKATLSRIYKYTILNRLSPLPHSSSYKYNINAFALLSRIYKYNIANKVTFVQTYKYHLTSLAHVILSSIYKYNIVNRLSLSRIYRYGFLNIIPKTQQYRYAIANSVSPTLTRVYRYKLSGGVSLSKTYLYRLNGKISLSTKYLYQIISVVSPVTWKLTGQDTDFPAKLEDLVKDYLIANWSISDPSLGPTPIITSTSSPKHQAQVDNFEYDTYRTYYLKIKEVRSTVTTRQIRFNTYEFETPIEIACYSRRLTKGQAFTELTKIINELMRIFGSYQKEQIFGVQGITLERITPIERSTPTPAQTLWVRQLNIILHYYKQSMVG